MRAMREELGLTQAQLASRMPDGPRGKRSSNWISQVEAGTIPVKLEWLPEFADALSTDMRWLVSGEASGETEFVSRLREMELQMDERGRREVLALAVRQVEEARRERERNAEAEFDRVKAALLAAGISPDALAQAEQSARRILRGQRPGTAGE